MATSETEKHNRIAEQIGGRIGGALVEVDRSYDDLVLVVEKSALADALKQLRDDHRMDLLLDIGGIDCLEMDDAPERFELEYTLYSVEDDCRVRVRVRMPETDMDVPTATNLWQSANWAEREAFEMFGFNFVGHPCLKRLLTHHEFEGHPLRKDYPVMDGQWCTVTSDLTDEMNEEQGGAPR